MSRFVWIDRSMLDDDFPPEQRLEWRGFRYTVEQESAAIEINIDVARAGNIDPSDAFYAPQFFGEASGYLSWVLFLPGSCLDSFGEFERHWKGQVSEIGTGRYFCRHLDQINIEQALDCRL